MRRRVLTRYSVPSEEQQRWQQDDGRGWLAEEWGWWLPGRTTVSARVLLPDEVSTTPSSKQPLECSVDELQQNSVGTANDAASRLPPPRATWAESRRPYEGSQLMRSMPLAGRLVEAAALPESRRLKPEAEAGQALERQKAERPWPAAEGLQAL